MKQRKKKSPTVQWHTKNWDNYRERRTGQKYWDWISKNWGNIDNEEHQEDSEPYRANPDKYLVEENTSSFIPDFSFEDFEQFLTEKQYLAIVMVFKYRLSFAEIARRVKNNPSTIKESYNVAVKKIRRYLESLENGTEIS